MFRALENDNIRKMLLQTLHYWMTIRIDHHLGYLGAGKQCTNNVVEKRFACQGTEVLPRDTLRVVTHGHESDNSWHITSWGDGSILTHYIGWVGCLWWFQER